MQVLSACQYEFTRSSRYNMQNKNIKSNEYGSLSAAAMYTATC